MAVKEAQLRLKNAEDIAEKMGLTPERTQRIRDREHDLAEAKEKCESASEQLAITLTKNDIEVMADMMAKDFAGFGEMAIPEQKKILKQYIEKVDVRQDEFAGIVLKFHARVGMPTFDYQRDEYPVEEAKPRAKKKSGKTEGAIRVSETVGKFGGVESIEQVKERLKQGNSTLKRTS